MSNKLFIGIIVVIFGAAIGYGVWASNNAQQQASVPIEGVKTYSELSREHTDQAVDYPQTPPVGGRHSSVWLDCTGKVYQEPVANEQAVHALEHGAVWVTYNDQLPQDQRQSLASKIEGSSHTFMSPLPEQSAPLKLTAWGLQLQLDSADDSRVDDFLTKYRQGEQTPEPGATCAPRHGGMSN